MPRGSLCKFISGKLVSPSSGNFCLARGLPRFPQIPGFLYQRADPSGCHKMHSCLSSIRVMSPPPPTTLNTLHILILYIV